MKELMIVLPATLDPEPEIVTGNQVRIKIQFYVYPNDDEECVDYIFIPLPEVAGRWIVKNNDQGIITLMEV